MQTNRTTTVKHGPSRQRGAALIIMLVVLVVGIAAILVNSLTSSKINIARQATTAAALAQAKDALIGFATAYSDTHSGEAPGYLPCPDDSGGNPEGSAEIQCLNQNFSVMGRLPWKTLGLPAIRDGDGVCLWYAVSGTYKYNPKTSLMNWDTKGKFKVYAADNTLLSDDVVAVIFAPGAVLPGQVHYSAGAPVCGGNYSPTNYLDSFNGINNYNAGNEKFIQGIKGGSFNDQMIFITRQEIWNAIQKRTQSTLKLMTQRVAECLADYGRHNNYDSGHKSLPWPAPLTLSDYGVVANYNDDANRYYGRVPYIVNDSKADSSNSMSGTNLMANNGLDCPNYSATPSTELQLLYPWWDNWKDHLFYALSREYRPKNSDTNSCGNCIEINGSGNYAAVVMFAGRSLSGQEDRASIFPTNAQRGDINKYLEGRNASNYPDSNGDGNYQTQANPSNAFNDILYCINTDLSVSLCPYP